MDYRLKGRNSLKDFEMRFKERMPYMERHMKTNLFWRLFYKLFFKNKFYNIVFDATDGGWAICNNQYQNANNPLYWENVK